MGGMVSRPTSRLLPVRASARAFVRPRFACIRASADVRPALPIFNVSCACIRAVLACPLSVDRDGFPSLSLSLTEGNAPAFGPIRGRQRLEIPRSIALPKASFAGESVFLQGAAQTGGKGRAARFRGYFRAYPRHAAKVMRNAGSGAEASPQTGGRGSAPSTITASGWASPPTERRRKQQHLAAIFRGWLAYPDRRQRPDHAERGRAAYTSQIRGKGRHKRRASARHRHAPQTCGTGGARPHIKAGGRCRPKCAASAGGASVLGTEPAGVPAAALRRPSYPKIRERVWFIFCWMASCVEIDFWISSVRLSLMLFNASRLARIRS